MRSSIDNNETTVHRPERSDGTPLSPPGQLDLLAGPCIQTSNFALAAHRQLPGCISIALHNPRWWPGPPKVPLAKFPLLAPPAWMLKKAKDELRSGGDPDRTWGWYSEEYRRLVLAPLTPEVTAERLRAIVEPADPVLLCWCKRGANCHRHLVAEWLKGAGLMVEEVG